MECMEELRNQLEFKEDLRGPRAVFGGTEETKWSFRRILFYSYLLKDSSCSACLGLVCQIFLVYGG